jgi:hypothetical protein
MPYDDNEAPRLAGSTGGTENHRDEINAGVREALAQLDGTKGSAVTMLTPAELAALGVPQSDCRPGRRSHPRDGPQPRRGVAEPGGVTDIKPTQGQTIWSTMIPPNIQARILELADTAEHDRR